MLTSLIVPRPRPLRVHIALANSFAVSNASSPRPRDHIQARAFRFGVWSSCLDGSYRYELRRRWRSLKQDHANAVNRKLPWLDHPLAEEPDLIMKRTVARHRSRWVSQGQLDNWKIGPYHSSYTTLRLDAEPWRSGMERSHTDKFNSRRYRQSHSGMKSQSESDMGSEHSNPNITAEMSESKTVIQPKSNLAVKPDYVIDPITNRKVPKGEDQALEIGLEPLTRTFDTYKSQFTPFAPPNLEQESPTVHSNGMPSDSELSKYAKNEFDDWSSAGAQSSPDSTNDPAQLETSSVSDNSTLKDEYALNHLPPEDSVEEHGEPHHIPNATSNATSEKSNPSGVSHFDLSHEPNSEPDKLQSELGKYGPYMYNRESTKDIPEEPKDIGKYRYRASEKPIHSTELPTKYDDLDKYEPTGFDEIKDENQPAEKYGDLEKYKALEHEESSKAEPLKRDIVTESLKEYESKEQDGVNSIHNTSEKIPRMDLPERHLFSKHFPVLKEAETSHSSGDFAGTREEMHRHMNELSEMSDAIDREINSNLHKTLQNLKDHIVEPSLSSQETIVQDTPEESQNHCNSYGGEPMATGNKSAISETLHSQVENLDQNVENNGAPKQASDRPNISSRLEPALNRHLTATKGDRLSHAFGADLYSKEPQGLETSFSEECGGKGTMPLYTRTYSNEPGQIAARSELTENEAHQPSEYSSDSYYHRDPEVDGIPELDSTGSKRDRGATQPEEPTIYKVLAYDPAVQSIKVAETTSVLPDLASPLSPMEVIPRLSNPAKFFPYFGPLQAEGFEIVSGHGDVLVFRQVRLGKAAAQGGVTVNPIDMMGRPAAVPNAAAFVSPTGFVNYDIPQVEDEPPEPAFRSNIHVHREEPVFSGPKPSSENMKSKKLRMKIAKRIIIGGAGAAGITYAFGVVSEYFTTGGADGKGPSGFSPA